MAGIGSDLPASFVQLTGAGSATNEADRGDGAIGNSLKKVANSSGGEPVKRTFANSEAPAEAPSQASVAGSFPAANRENGVRQPNQTTVIFNNPTVPSSTPISPRNNQASQASEFEQDATVLAEQDRTFWCSKLSCGICGRSDKQSPSPYGQHGGDRRTLWQEYDECFLQRKVPLNPFGRLKLYWDIPVLLAVTYVVLYVPYSIAWNTRFLPWIAFDVITNVFFILDVVVNFHTSFITADGELEPSLKKCAIHYAKGWMVLDIISSFPYDLVFLFVSANTGAAEALKALKLFRLLRVTLIIKYVIKLGLSVISALFLLLCGFVLTCHWFGCILWFIAVQEGIQNSWVVRQGSISGLDTQPDYVQYSTSIYWAIVTTTTLGYGDITATTYVEQVYTTIIILVGALSYALIIASVQQIVTWRFSAGAEYNRWMDSVVKFADLHHLPPVLRTKLLGYYRYVWERRKTFDNTTVLDDLPFELRADVADHIHSKVFLNNPVFCVSGMGFRHMLASKLGPGKVKLPDDVLFFEGECILDIVVVRRGALELVAGLDTYDELIVSSRRDGQYCGDLGIFEENAVHFVSVVVSDYSDIHHIPAGDFLSVLDNFPKEKILFQRVAEARKLEIEKLLASFRDFSMDDWKGSMRGRDLGGPGNNSGNNLGSGGGLSTLYSQRNIVFSQRNLAGGGGHYGKNVSTAEVELWHTWEEAVTPEADEAICQKVVKLPLPPNLFFQYNDQTTPTTESNVVEGASTADAATAQQLGFREGGSLNRPSPIATKVSGSAADGDAGTATNSPNSDSPRVASKGERVSPMLLGVLTGSDNPLLPNSPTTRRRKLPPDQQGSLSASSAYLGRSATSGFTAEATNGGGSSNVSPPYGPASTTQLEALVLALGSQVEELERKLNVKPPVALQSAAPQHKPRYMRSLSETE